MTKTRDKKGTPTRKICVSLYLSADVIAAFKSTGPGWQGRIDDVLRKAAETLRT